MEMFMSSKKIKIRDVHGNIVSVDLQELKKTYEEYRNKDDKKDDE